MAWVPLAILCAFAFASTDALTKKFLSDYSAAELVVVRFGFAGLLTAPMYFWYPLPSVPPAFWLWIAAAVPLEILALLIYMRAIRESPLSLTLPYLSFTPVFTVLIGYILLGEQITGQGYAGIALVVIGAYGLNIDKASLSKWRSWAEPLRAILFEQGSRLMLMVAVIYGLTSVLGKGALQYVPGLTFGVFYFVVLGTTSLVVFAVRDFTIISMLGRRLRWHFAVGGTMAIMAITHFVALELAPNAAYMISVKRTSVLFGILYGALLFREERLRERLLAGLVMVIGVILIAT